MARAVDPGGSGGRAGSRSSASLLDVADDPRHRLDHMRRVTPTLVSAGQHQCVGAVQDRVGDVGHLGARRAARRSSSSPASAWPRSPACPRGGTGRSPASAPAAPPRSGSSTPRSPRATMMPLNASTISSRCAIACGFSTFASTGTAAAHLVHDRVHRVDVRGGAHERQRHQVHPGSQRPPQVGSSLSVRRRDLTPTEGRFRPLWSETTPPSTTRVTTGGPSTSTTRTDTGRRRSGSGRPASRRRAGSRTWWSRSRWSPGTSCRW